MNLCSNEARDGVKHKVEQCKHIFKSGGYTLSWSKIEHLKYGFSGKEEGGKRVTMDGVVIPSSKKFRYLGPITEKKGDIDENINQCIRSGWKKWWSAFHVLCDNKIHVQLKERVYHLVVRPT